MASSGQIRAPSYTAAPMGRAKKIGALLRPVEFFSGRVMVLLLAVSALT